MAGRVPGRAGVDGLDELSRFETHGIRVRNGIRAADGGDRTFVELTQTAKRAGRKREQLFFAAFERLAAIEAKAREIWRGSERREGPERKFVAPFGGLAAIESQAREVWRGEQWERRRHGDAEEKGRAVELSRFTRNGIDVRVGVRPDGVPFVRLSQTSRRPDGEERTQRFDIRLDRLSEVVGRSREAQPKEWYALAQIEQRLETGAVVTVRKAFASRTEAELAAHNSSLFVISQPFQARPEEGQRHVMSQGESKKLDRQIREARWKEEANGEFHAVGRWYDKESEPHPKQRVRVSAYAEYRGELFEYRVTPRGGPLDQGPRDEPLLVVFRKPERPDGLPRIAAVCKDEREASARMRDLDDGVRARNIAADKKRWEEVDFSAGLRAQVPTKPIRTVVVGESRGILVERTDEHGGKRKNVELTRPERQADGTVKEVTSTYTLKEFRAFSDGLLPRGRRAERPKAQEQPSIEPSAEAERKPAADRRERPKAQEQPRARAEPAYVDNKHFILTRWQAKEMPEKGVTWVRFPLGESELEDRPSFPAHGRWTPRDASDPVAYLLVKRTLEKQGVGVAEGVVVGEEKRASALERTKVREGQAATREQYEQRVEAQRQERQQARGMSHGF